MIWQFQPYGLDGDYGKACNQYVELVKDPNDYIVIWDCDVMVLTPSHGQLLQRAVDENPDIGLFTCYTSRVGQLSQVYSHEDLENDSMSDHRNIALDLYKEFGSSIKIFNHPISGYMMMFKKQTWIDVGGFTSGILGVDNHFSNGVLKLKKDIAIIRGLYCMHYYRFNEGMRYRDHLKIK